MGNRSILRGVLAALCAMLCLTATGCDAITGRARSFTPVRGPLIAVLGQTPYRVVLLDAATLELRGTVRLRSQSIGMTSLAGTIVTAQCGGLGDKSDSRVGFLRPYDGRIEYLDLGVLDPEEVWASGQDWCVALNGLVDAAGMKCERIGVSRGTCETFTLPPAGQAGAGTQNHVWILRKGVSGEGDRASEDFYVFGETGEPRVVASDATATLDLCGFGDAVVTVEPAGDGARLVRRDEETGEVLCENRIQDLVIGPGCAWSAGGVLVLADYRNGEGREVREVVLVDPVTLVVRRRIAVDGLGSVGAGGDGRLVVCEADGDVLLYASSDGTMIAGTTIEGREEELLEVVYVEPDGRRLPDK